MRVGFIGLGQAAALILEDIRSRRHPRWRVVAGADPREHARETFAREYGCSVYADAAGLVRDENVDVVYIATPPALHLEHASLAARDGKHAIVEKPLTLKLDEARQMVAIADQAGTKLLAGHTHSFDAPIRAMQRLVESGELGPLRAINSWNFNEFNHRPRLHSELVDTHGPVFNQGPHHVDIVRQIAGGLVRSVRGTTIPDGITGVEGGYVATSSSRPASPPRSSTTAAASSTRPSSSNGAVRAAVIAIRRRTPSAAVRFWSWPEPRRASVTRCSTRKRNAAATVRRSTSRAIRPRSR